MSDYAGKKVVITGGSGGIGFAAAQLLAAGGARVLITGRDPDRLGTARDRLGGDVVAVRSDTAVPAEVDALAQRVRAECGTVDALLVNAGITSNRPFAQVTADDYDEVFAVNTRGPYFTVQRLAPLLADGGGVVFTTSVAGTKGLPASSVYAASKAALRSMTRSLARELLARNIRVNAVSPGPIDTGILRRSMPADAAAGLEAQFVARNPMGRLGEPAEVARAMLFLAFDATYTTGAELTVDGGAAQL
ncbi:SDR family oxidoreductase [Dactylosporangium vinaceum]|uniref:SDR family oxidoreductase n=1 Tax=Dactylosporangium vinaceum TaxID=53362 RepID=A0ABV5MSN6_9ACTN|nr:SDR family oxidoreductase [Dactylosporangium vinaceum]UAC00942.1 SDR family oxidoreductase [Dactylosporangium vinaceum]